MRHARVAVAAQEGGSHAGVSRCWLGAERPSARALALRGSSCTPPPPRTSRPFTIGCPASSVTLTRPIGPWHTAATTFPARARPPTTWQGGVGGTVQSGQGIARGSKAPLAVSLLLRGPLPAAPSCRAAAWRSLTAAALPAMGGSKGRLEWWQAGWGASL